MPPHADLTTRMALFGRLFAQHAGILEAGRVHSSEDLVALVRLHIPRDATTAEEAPVYEAAAYVGEWFREEGDAEWISEGPTEPHLQLSDDTGALILLLPLVSIIRTAATAGYDGLPKLLRDAREDVARPAQPTALEGLRVWPENDRQKVVDWVAANRTVSQGTRVALWRRCGACGSPHEESLTMPPTGADWEAEAGLATGLLAQREFACECGGPAGSVSRLLMLRRDDSGERLGDIYVTPNFTRVACWTLHGDEARPFDARQATEEPRSIF